MEYFRSIEIKTKQQYKAHTHFTILISCGCPFCVSGNASACWNFQLSATGCLTRRERELQFLTSRTKFISFVCAVSYMEMLTMEFVRHMFHEIRIPWTSNSLMSQTKNNLVLCSLLRLVYHRYQCKQLDRNLVGRSDFSTFCRQTPSRRTPVASNTTLKNWINPN